MTGFSSLHSPSAYSRGKGLPSAVSLYTAFTNIISCEMAVLTFRAM